MTLWLWLAVGALGGGFAIARFLVDAFVSSRAASEFPWGTFAVNISGSLALGVLSGAAVAGRLSLLAYLLGSLAAGLAAAALGRWIGRAL